MRGIEVNRYRLGNTGNQRLEENKKRVVSRYGGLGLQGGKAYGSRRFLLDKGRILG